MPDSPVVVMNPAEWRENAQAALKRLGLSYEDLQQQARDRNFVSTAARKLWVLIGDTL
ncbi:hypothetical protein ABZ570_03415 [Micromonospora sp. NPDC007271]|uniref:hypothetical protein n=1 Tax=Micromonospora sp. NPDC007271 TaxID=3154587 RepID=UPI00340A45B4